MSFWLWLGRAVSIHLVPASSHHPESTFFFSPSFVGTRQVNMQAEVPLSLYSVFLEGYNRVPPLHEESSSSSSLFLGGRRSGCPRQQSSAATSWNAVVASGLMAWVRWCLDHMKAQLWTGPVRTDAIGCFSPLRRVRQMLLRELHVLEITKAKFGWLAALCWRGRETFLPNTKWWGSKVRTLSFSFHKSLGGKISEGKNT